MTRRTGPEIAETAYQLRETLSRHPSGVHRLNAPAVVLDAALPEPLAAVYRMFDGGDLFHESLLLRPSTRVELRGERYLVGEVAGDDLYVGASDGVVWRLETDTEEWVEEGSRFDRWLLGWVEAESLLIDDEGEFLGELFDEGGELVDEAVIRRERRLLKRDRSAIGPRWRLSRALARQGKLEAAREELEEVVRLRASFGWAWYDLARISERMGDVTAAVDDARTAAEADPDYPYAGFFYGHAARLAARAGDEAARAELARKALELEPELARSQRAGAAESLDSGDYEAARELAEVAAALEPRDLEAKDLLRRLDDALN